MRFCHAYEVCCLQVKWVRAASGNTSQLWCQFDELTDPFFLHLVATADALVCERLSRGCSCDVNHNLAINKLQQTLQKSQHRVGCHRVPRPDAFIAAHLPLPVTYPTHSESHLNHQVHHATQHPSALTSHRIFLRGLGQSPLPGTLDAALICLVALACFVHSFFLS